MNVVNDEDIEVEVEDTADVGLKDVGNVVPGVAKRALEGVTHGGGDEAGDEVRAESVDLEAERGEDGADEAMVVVGGEEVEENGTRAGGVAEDGVDSSDEAADVL